MKDNHKLDEQIEEYLVQKIKPKELISFEAKQFLVSAQKAM